MQRVPRTTSSRPSSRRWRERAASACATMRGLDAVPRRDLVLTQGHAGRRGAFLRRRPRPTPLPARPCASTSPILPPRAPSRWASCSGSPCRRTGRCGLADDAGGTGWTEDSRAYDLPAARAATRSRRRGLSRSPSPRSARWPRPHGARTALQAGDRLLLTGHDRRCGRGLRLRQEARADAPWIGTRRRRRRRPARPLPCCRAQAWLRDALLGHARAAMDVSDGLVGDLGKMLKLAGLTARLRLAHVPAVRGAARWQSSLSRHPATGPP